MSDKTLSDLKYDAHVAVLHTKVDALIEKQKELTGRVRANEKVVAAIGLLGSIALAFIGAGYFAPKAEACSPRLDGEPTYCGPQDGVLEKPVAVSTPEEEEDPLFKTRITLYDTRVAQAESAPTAGEWINEMREWEAEKTRTSPEDSINNALADMEYEDGSDDTPKQEELLQLPSSVDRQSTGRGHDRCHHRSWIRFIQERTGKNCGS